MFENFYLRANIFSFVGFPSTEREVKKLKVHVYVRFLSSRFQFLTYRVYSLRPRMFLSRIKYVVFIKSIGRIVSYSIFFVYRHI